MKKKEATKVECSTCKSNKGVKKTQRFLYIFGGVIFILSIYGGIKLVKDIMSLF